MKTKDCPISAQLPALLPFEDGKVACTGRVGTDVDVEQARAAAKTCALNILAHAREAVGSLARIRRVLQVQGFVNAGPEFTRHPEVINGASDLLVEIFAEKGRHTRFAVGASSLPMNASVEVVATFQIVTGGHKDSNG